MANSDLTGRFKAHLAKYIRDHDCYGHDAFDKREFVPRDALSRFWTPDQIVNCLCRTRQDERIPADRQNILHHYLAVFSILVFISRSEYISAFMCTETPLDDAHLPIRSTPEEWTHDVKLKEVFEEFDKAQWRFCPLTLDRRPWKWKLSPYHILPVGSKRLIDPRSDEEDDDVLVYEADWHPLCHRSVLESSRVVLKTYHMRTQAVTNSLNNEIDVYSNLEESAFKHVIGYFGSFEQQGKLTMMLEHASRGNLLDFWEKNALPNTVQDKINFWESFFMLLQALDATHNLNPVAGTAQDTGQWLLKGMHQDIRPQNILITETEGNSFIITFKLTDFGTGHVRRCRYHGFDPMAAQRKGNGMYGPPESVRDDYASRLQLCESDIWFLGSVASEQLVWSIRGNGHRLKYQEERQTATDKTQLRGGYHDGCFHDGECRLPVVDEIHLSVLESIDQDDIISPIVSKIILDHMLVANVAERSNARNAYAAWKRELNAVRYQVPLRRKGTNQSHISGISGISGFTNRMSATDLLSSPQAFNRAGNLWLESTDTMAWEPGQHFDPDHSSSYHPAPSRHVQFEERWGQGHAGPSSVSHGLGPGLARGMPRRETNKSLGLGTPVQPIPESINEAASGITGQPSTPPSRPPGLFRASTSAFSNRPLSSTPPTMPSRRTTVDDHYGVDTISDVSEISSIFSSSSSLQSFSSGGSSEYIGSTAAQHMAYTLFRDQHLGPLYDQAIQKVGADRFSKNHDRIFKTFLLDLRLTARDHNLLQTIRILRTRVQREQVTKQICDLFQLSHSVADAQAMKQFLLHQKEDREYRLNRFLTQSEEARSTDTATTTSVGSLENKAKKEFEHRNENENEDEEDEGIEEEEEEDGEDEEDEEDEEHGEDDGVKKGPTRRLQQLDSVVGLLTSGPAFETFKSNIHYFINPPTTIQEALAAKNIDILRQLLKRRFNLVACAEYSWLHELHDIGYTSDEIADLLFEQANDAPWIYFEPAAFDAMEVHPGVHLPGCVHSLFSSSQSSPDQNRDLALYSVKPGDSRDIAEVIHELCGLAGVAPVSRDPKEWNGFIRFEERNSVAAVSYSQPADTNFPEYRTIFSRISKVLDAFCNATGRVQASGLCCDSFTILTRSSRNQDQQDHAGSVVEVCRIDFENAIQLQEETRRLSKSSSISTADALRLRKIASEILKPLMQESAQLPDNSIDFTIHSCSLAAQLMCLGFLSYSQAHIGPIQPFYLDTPLSRIQLLGCQTSTDQLYHVQCNLVNLTCIGDMIRDSVLAFSLFQPQARSRSVIESQAYDLLTNAEDLLDTWGPGHFIIPKGKNKPSAISLGDGIVWLSDLRNNKFHWSQNVTHDVFTQGVIEPCSKIIIGTPVTVNENCRIDEEHCWHTSSTCLESLGPYSTGWEQAEKQYGMQAGNYIILQANLTWRKRRGQTLKHHRLQQEDASLIPFLEDLWGVQVSFCTGVARRVPLREMIADLLPVFAKFYMTKKDEGCMWKELQSNHGVADAFRLTGIREWLFNLPPNLHQLVLKMVRRIFNALKDTGVDQEGKYLCVAWPHERDVFRCFKVPCEKENSWAHVLADSEDCATFAYISSKCFETERFRCSGGNASWQNTIPLLQTAVVFPSRKPAGLAVALQHKATHFFQKLDNLFFVTVLRPNESGTANLVTSPSSIPLSIRQRLYTKFKNEGHKQQARLREKKPTDVDAEPVAIHA
ncbi:hypothetical protein QBC37DRAFT_381340 [Rhypophila decipiens]|uniref:Protein kinase domain-containing protein n=1 Tax=Rhypophila decipiens TaxID=261697 RepID=A0AAN7B2S8_9PEZI|nr:hypothetical protein QBC37DRAFT_381340 [Rhypophila decipiens]